MKFIQQALSESQQSLSLLNTDVSLRDKLSSKMGWISILLGLHKETPVPLSKQNVMYLYLMSLLYHLY